MDGWMDGWNACMFVAGIIDIFLISSPHVFNHM